MPADDHTPETRRKRAKIVSACGECRRKKTKCNGEHPCRNCVKSAVPCVYPSSSSNTDDKRNAHSKQALEAIEERLKAIEDMLRKILQSHITAADLDPVAVNNFLNQNKSLSSSPVSPPSPLPPPLLTSSSSSSVPQQQPPASCSSSSPSSSLPLLAQPPSTTTSSSSNDSHTSDLRLPSIHHLPSYAQHPPDIIKQEPRNLPYPQHYLSYTDNHPRDGDRVIHANQ